MRQKINTILLIVLNLTVLPVTAANLNIELDTTSPAPEQTLYRSNFFYTHEDYADKSQGSYPPEQADLEAFNGWKIQLNWEEHDGVTPDTYLNIELTEDNHANNMNCSFTIGNTTQTLFSLAPDGRTIVLNPNLPPEYLTPPATTPEHPLHCEAKITAESIDGSTKSDNHIRLAINYYPQPTPIIPADNMRYLRIENQGYSLNTAPPNFVLSHDGPLITSGMRAEAGFTAQDFTVYGDSTSHVTITGNAIAANSDGNPACLYYPNYKTAALPNKTASDSLDVDLTEHNTPDNPLIVTANWTELCPNQNAEEGFNEYHSMSASLQSKNRFQYGTYTVVMKGNPTSGTNTAFFTYYAPNNIPDGQGGYHNFGYAWHEIDVELIPGVPIANQQPYPQAPWYQGYGFRRPVTEPEFASKSVSWNIISPGNYAKHPDGFGAINHERYCFNPNDSTELTHQEKFPGQCYPPQQSSNPFDGNFHEYQIQWSPDKIKFLVDRELSYQVDLRDLDKAAGIDTNVNPATLWNEGFFLGGDGKKYPVSPAHIMLNFWVIAPQDWDGVFGGIKPGETTNAEYRSISWDPIVENQNIGKVYNAAGELLEADKQHAYTWNFDKMHEHAALFEDWQFDPAGGFDSNNSYFVQNSVLLQNGALNLCMADQWSNMASYTVDDTLGLKGTRSKGCDGDEILPPPYIVGNTDVALLKIKARFKDTPEEIQQGMSRGYVVAHQVLPQQPANYPNGPLIPAYAQYNGGWVPEQGNGCTTNSIEGKWCDGNGWHANPFFAYYDDINDYEANFLVYVSTRDADGEAYENINLIPGEAMFSSSVAGKEVSCQVAYQENSLELKSGSNILIHAELECGFVE